MSYSLTIVAKGRGNLRRLTSSGSLRRVVQTTCFTDNTTYNVVALGTRGQVLPQVQLDNKLKLVNRLNLVTPPPVVATPTTQQSQNASETTAADTSNTGTQQTHMYIYVYVVVCTQIHTYMYNMLHNIFIINYRIIKPKTGCSDIYNIQYIWIDCLHDRCLDTCSTTDLQTHIHAKCNH